MIIKYSLSNRQLSEYGKGATLAVAIPLDSLSPTPPTSNAWVTLRLPWLKGKSFETFSDSVRVDPRINPIGSPLSKRLGTIVSEDKIGWTIPVLVVVFSKDGNVGATDKIQWPGGDFAIG